MNGHIERLLTAHRRYGDWRLERVACAPKIDHAMRVSLEALGAIPQDLTDLLQGL